MSFIRQALAPLALLLSLAPSAGANGNPAFAQAPVVYGFAKAMFVTDDKKGGRPNQNTPGFGGKLGIATGEYSGFSLKGAWYATSDLGLRSHNPRETDAYMFNLEKLPYSLLGEAQIGYRSEQTQLTLGRQEMDSPLMASGDYRIIPNLFEAYTLHNTSLPDTKITLAHVSKMSGLDSLTSFSEFRSMSQQAYTSLMVTADGQIDARRGDILDLSSVAGNKGVWLAGIKYEKDFRLQLWHYQGNDTLRTMYLDGSYRQALDDRLSLQLEAQTYQVAAVGRFKRYLLEHGLNASYGLQGVKATLADKPSGVSLALAHNRFSGNAQTVTAYSNWGGYPEFVSMPYLYAENTGVSAIARSRLSKATLLLDLSAMGLSGHSLLFGHARINVDETILAGSDLQVNTLLYRAKLLPGWMLRLALEARKSGNARYDNAFAAIALRHDF